MDPNSSKKDEVLSVEISIGNDEASESSAERTGWVVDVRYTNAPDTTIFNQTFPSEAQAKKVMDDLVNLAAEVEGLIRQEKFEDAKKRSGDFLKKTKANSQQPNVEEQDNA
jgi:uncharacterized protein YfcZ (UPF0381/DUF406 family)